jgi:hypothetical protein
MVIKIQNLLFPSLFRKVRSSRGLLQKTVAIDLGLDPAVLCCVEKGTRAPFDSATLNRATAIYKFSDAESDLLAWAAHHDRLVGSLHQRGASNVEVEFFSNGLRALRHLQPEQVQGLLANLKEIDKSASLVASLRYSSNLLETNMT